MKILISWMRLGKKSKVKLVKILVQISFIFLNLNRNLNKLINFDLFAKCKVMLDIKVIKSHRKVRLIRS